MSGVKMEEKKQPKINVKISVDWECGEEELLEQCKACKTYDDLHKVISDNIIINEFQYLMEE